VSIYFPEHVQRVIFAKLADLLVDGGYLIVGATETIHHDFGVLTLVERDGLFVYQKLPGAAVQDRRSATRGLPAAAEPRNPAPVTKPLSRISARVAPVGTVAKKTVVAQSVAPDMDARSAFDEALQLAANGNEEKSLACLTKVIELDPTFVTAHTLAASIHIHSSHYDKARYEAEAALAGDPHCSEALLMLGIIERHEGNNNAAYTRFREAKYLNPDCWLSYVHLAEIDFAQKERQRARSGYAAALALLEKGTLKERGQDFFPLTINAEQFLHLCRHKMALLKKLEL
jgi:chemotaxis protein methyltransferase CheR